MPGASKIYAASQLWNSMISSSSLSVSSFCFRVSVVRRGVRHLNYSSKNHCNHSSNKHLNYSYSMFVIHMYISNAWQPQKRLQLAAEQAASMLTFTKGSLASSNSSASSTKPERTTDAGQIHSIQSYTDWDIPEGVAVGSCACSGAAAPLVVNQEYGTNIRLGF